MTSVTPKVELVIYEIHYTPGNLNALLPIPTDRIRYAVVGWKDDERSKVYDYIRREGLFRITNSSLVSSAAVRWSKMCHYWIPITEEEEKNGSYWSYWMKGSQFWIKASYQQAQKYSKEQADKVNANWEGVKFMEDVIEIDEYIKKQTETFKTNIRTGMSNLQV